MARAILDSRRRRLEAQVPPIPQKELAPVLTNPSRTTHGTHKNHKMSDVTITPVMSARQRKQFLQLPWTLYHDDPNWIPPLRRNLEELVGYKPHPFYERNEGQTFLALRNGTPCGRVAAIVNQAHIERYDERRGFLGFFESIEDQEVASALFDAVRLWFAKRDIVDFRGPINPSLNYEIGLLIDGFDTPPYFMMTYNPAYYAGLFEQYGFRKAQDLYAFLGQVDMLKTLDSKISFVSQEAKRRFDVTLRGLDRSRFDEDVRLFLEIYNQSLGGTWGYTPLSEGEIAHMSHSLKHLIVPELTSIAEVEGRPVACAFALLDYNPRIKAIDGRLFPLGFLRLLWNRKAIKRIRIIAANVLPEYQKWGLGLAVLSRLVPEVLHWGIREVEFSWVLESNQLSYGTLKKGGVKLNKTYRIYDYGPNEDQTLTRK